MTIILSLWLNWKVKTGVFPKRSFLFIRYKGLYIVWDGDVFSSSFKYIGQHCESTKENLIKYFHYKIMSKFNRKLRSTNKYFADFYIAVSSEFRP